MKLKSAIAFLFVVPVIAFGQVNKQVCFEATKSVQHAPKTLCLVSIQEANNPMQMSVLSGDINFPEVLDVTSFIRHNEDRYKFEAQGLIERDWEVPGCGEGFETTLKVKGQSSYGVIAANELKITVEVDSVRDVCHDTNAQTEVVEYTLVK